ncbi:hypothetical protein HA402_014394 [Bradysia odoriphaga]|nr:hypothetical protein HA402_014394 [Bradysia odoriphaga]
MSLHETVVFAGPQNETLTLYQSKKSKSVGILSTFHDSVTVDDTADKKPDTIRFYNNTKYGVDIADGMAKAHSSESCFAKMASARILQHIGSRSNQRLDLISRGNGEEDFST